MSHIRVKSIAVNSEVLDRYDMNPFTAKSPFGIPIKLLLGIFVLLHFFVGLFYFNEDDDRLGDWADDKGGIVKFFYWIIKIPLIILGYGFGLILIPVQIVTVPFVLLYIALSKEKDYYW